MKTTLRRWTGSSLKIVAFVTFALLAACAEEELEAPEASRSAEAIEAPTGEADSGPFSALGGCPDDLTNDGCNFTSGTGRDHPNQYLMVNMMNNCRTEPLPSNCTWSGNITETRNIEVDLNNCCYPASSLNFQMNTWKALAASNRPASNFLITNYQRISGYMVTSYGPYRMVIRVTYRKRGLCSEVAEKGGIALPQ
jgi:hypothetical protein